MKRMKESGAAFRKKRKMRIEHEKRDKDAMLKYIRPTQRPSLKTQEQPEASEIISGTAFPAATDDVLSCCSSAEIDIACEVTSTPAASSVSTNTAAADESPADATTSASVKASHSTLVDASSFNSLTDIVQWPSKINDTVRTILVQNGTNVVQHIDSKFKEVVRPGSSTKGESRKLTKSWFYRTLPNGEKLLRTWMAYSPSKEALFCFSCKLFEVSNWNFASKDGFKNWWKLNPKVRDHEQSNSHIKAFTAWKELEIRLTQGKAIDHVEQELIENEAKKWRQILYRLLDIIKFLAKQNLAFRGHRETLEESAEINSGNFLELVKLLSKYDPVLREHVLRVTLGKPHSLSYLTPQIQNEFVNCLGDLVRTKIIEQVKNSKYYCIIFDSTPDISHKDQLSQVIRYVKMDDNDVKVEESFLRFIEMKGKTAEQITEQILKQLEEDGLQIAVMAGHRSGVQKRIADTNPRAVFVPCTNHTLNLACVHAATASVHFVTFFGTLERLFTFFSGSPHRWDILMEMTGASVKRMVDTRWSSRYAAVDIVYKKFSEIVTALERLMGVEENSITRSDAGVVLQAILSFSFLTFLGLWNAILLEINDAQKYMQTKGLCLNQCALKISALKKMLNEDRINLVDESLKDSKRICLELGISAERRIRKKRQLPGEESSGSELSLDAELKQEMLCAVDRIIEELTSRLANRFDFLMPANLLNESYHSQLDQIDENVPLEEFLSERKRL